MRHFWVWVAEFVKLAKCPSSGGATSAAAQGPILAGTPPRAACGARPAQRPSYSDAPKPDVMGPLVVPSPVSERADSPRPGHRIV
jgi:hypothetical protein